MGEAIKQEWGPEVDTDVDGESLVEITDAPEQAAATGGGDGADGTAITLTDGPTAPPTDAAQAVNAAGDPVAGPGTVPALLDPDGGKAKEPALTSDTMYADLCAGTAEAFTGKGTRKTRDTIAQFDVSKRSLFYLCNSGYALKKFLELD